MSQNNDFFNSFEGNNNSNSSLQQRKPKPPPPPRRPATTTSTTASTSANYYGAPAAATASLSSTTTTMNQSVRQQPPKPQTAQRPVASSTSTSSSLYYNAPSFAPAPSNHATTFQPQSNSNTNVPAYGGGNPVFASARTAATPSYNPAAPGYNTTPAAASSTDWYTDYSASSTNNNNMTTDASANPYNTSLLSGSMEGAVLPDTTAATPSYFTPTMNNNMASSSSSPSYAEDMEHEPPLLEELGINLQQIFMKTKAVVIPFRRLAGNTALMDPSLIVEDADLAGPLVFALALGFELLLGLEVEFGAIYGFGLAGCVSMTLILNLMSPTHAVSFWTVTSILGYALLPVNILAALKILLQNLAGFQTLVRFLAVLTILWCTTASTRLLEVGCGMAHQRYLIAYPIALLYTAFVLITIF